MKSGVLAMIATLSQVLACSSGSSAPAPPIETSGPMCNPPACTVSPAAAAIAFETVPDADGGACAAPFGPVSLPGGLAAFDAISECGGVKSQCGSQDYGIVSGTNGEVTCQVMNEEAFVVDGRVTSEGTIVAIHGTASGASFPVTVSVVSPDAGTPPGLTCTAVARALAPGLVYANFSCPSVAGCVSRGTFVFQNCAKQ